MFFQSAADRFGVPDSRLFAGLALVSAVTYLAFALLTLVAGIDVIFVLVMVHFVGWSVYAATSIAQRPKEVQQAVTWRQPNRWIRENLTGFIVFHTALCVFFFVA